MPEYQGKHEAEGPVDGGGFIPHISPQVRTAAYYFVLILDILGVVIVGTGRIMGWLNDTQADEITFLILLVINMVTSGLAVRYRPTR